MELGCTDSHAYWCDSCDAHFPTSHDHDDEDWGDDDDDDNGLDVHGFDYNPRSWKFLTLPGEQTKEFYAIELEVAYNHQPRAESTMQQIFANAEDCYFKHMGRSRTARVDLASRLSRSR